MLLQKLGFLLLMFVTANALQIHKFSKLSLASGTVFKVNRTLISLSNRKNSISVTWGRDRNNCNTELPSFLEPGAYHSFVKVSVLGNDKIILRSYESTASRTKVWRFVSMNHTACIAQEIGLQIRADVQNDDISAVIANYDTFDVFTNNKTCSPCRYNDKGVRISLDHTLVHSGSTGPRYFRSNPEENELRISLIKENDPSEGYLLVQQFNNNCSTLLQRLDSNFQVLVQRIVDVAVDAFSTDYGKLRICTLPHCRVSMLRGNPEGNLASHEPLTCQLLNIDNLESVKTSTLNQVAPGGELKALMVQNLPDGSAKVTYVHDRDCFEGDGEGSSAELYDQKISPEGDVEPAEKFQETMQCWAYRLDSIVLGPDEHCTVAYDGVGHPQWAQDVYQTCTQKI